MANLDEADAIIRAAAAVPLGRPRGRLKVASLGDGHGVRLVIKLKIKHRNEKTRRTIVTTGFRE
jgi:hypothetical protein